MIKRMRKKPRKIDNIEKEVLKEALKEWLNDRFSEFGKFSLGAFITAILGFSVYAILILNGWHK